MVNQRCVRGHSYFESAVSLYYSVKTCRETIYASCILTALLVRLQKPSSLHKSATDGDIFVDLLDVYKMT